MIFKWFDTNDIDALAKRMARDMIERIPPAKFEGGSRKSETKKDKAHDLVLRQAHEFARDNSLNVYKKARLANNFKWALIEAGYPKDFVDRMTIELAAVVAAAQSDRK